MTARRIIAVLLAACLVGYIVGLNVWGIANATEREPKLVIIGDSYAGAADSPVGTWSTDVGVAMGLDVHRYAVANSGVSKASKRCAGGTYTSRLGSIELHEPEWLIVIDAVNDDLMCSDGSYYHAARWQVRNETDDFMRELTVRAVRLGIPRDHIIVVNPMTHAMRGKSWAGDLMETAAARHDLTMLRPYFTVWETTDDNIHLSPRGHEALTAELAAVIGDAS